MKEKIETAVGGCLAALVTWRGIDAFLSEGTKLIGFFTAMFGLATAILIFVWWLRKVGKQKK